MNARIGLPSGNHIVLAQASTDGSTRTKSTPNAGNGSSSLGEGEVKQQTKGGSSGKDGSAGSVKIGVHPDLSGLPGAQSASQTGINVVGGLVFIGLVVFALIGVLRIAVGNGLDLPDHSLGGKKMLLYAVPLAGIASMLGQLVGWGWGLGVA